MYAKIKDDQIVQFPYSFGELQADNPYTNYGSNTDFVTIFPDTEEATLRGHVLVPVTDAPAPDHDPRTQRIEQLTPIKVNGEWVREWRVADKTQEEMAQEATFQAQNIRAQRTQKLKDSDWTQVADAPVDQAAWATYRQALRDLPAQPGFPMSINWPVAPA